MGSAPLAAVAAPEPPPEPALGAELRELEEISLALEQHTLADSTRRAYAGAWRTFAAFCAEHRLEPLPAHPETVRWYVAWMSVQTDPDGLPRFSVATIRLHLAGLAERHLRDGFLDPTGHRAVSDLVRGLIKLRATRPRRMRPLLLDDLLRVIGAMEHDVYPAGISAARDTAALWLGFAGALRRSEVAALRLTSLQLHPHDGIHVHVGRSKADPGNALPDVVVLPTGSSPVTCAPCALHRWLALVRLTETHDPTGLRRAIMRQLFGYQLDHHVCGAGTAPGLISSADLTAGTPLLRATYRNRHSGRIHATGVSGDALHTMLQTRLAAAGIDPTGYGFHSLRSGFVTQARRNGADFRDVRRQTRHRTDLMVDAYDRDYVPLAGNAVTDLGL
ncbi:hypothetical protein [Granulicoccus phenolivorans]|uniref:hypothetical protein n=1 Tax=Granulicoccus phenolivorans TaxID=266854 RepID=UPI0004050F55|nr:hypothetical protein [Granulicoccus phenolivorans]